MSDLNLSLILRLVDRATGPARAAIANVNSAANAVSQAGARTVAWADKQMGAVQASRAAMRGQALEAIAVGAALAMLTKPAIDMEKSMAGVRKVIDFQDQTVFGKLQNDILNLISSKGIPMTAEGIASIIESAGQAGIVSASLGDEEKRRQLIAYAEAAAKMGVAFDVSAEQAGAAMTMWRSRLRMSHEDALVMGDAVNHLSNNMDATAAAILNVINRQGAVAQSSGLARENIAALSAAFVASAPSPEIAATGMKNFLSVMTTGEGLTDARKSVLKDLGMDAEALAKRMQVDAKGAILDVMEALAKLPEHAQAAALTKLFGEESKSAITPLLTNLDMLRNSFVLVGDPAEFAGSMLKEYESQASTTAANVMKLTGFLKALSVTAGSAVLPALNDLLATLYPILDAVRAWAEANPELIETGVKLAAGLVALKLASVGVRWAFLTMAMPVLTATRAIGRGAQFGAAGMKLLTRGATAFGRAFVALAGLRPLPWSRLVPALAWTSKLIPAIPWMKLLSVFALTKLIRPINWTARTLPNFAPAAARFAAFEASAGRHMDNTVRKVEGATARMNQRIAAIKASAVGLGIGMLFLAGSMPKPQEIGPLPEDARAREAELARRAAAAREAAIAREDKARDLPVVGSLMGFFDKTYERVTGAPAPSAASLPVGADLSNLSPGQFGAVTSLRAAKSDGLPMARVQELAEQKEEVLAEIRDLERRLASMGDGPEADLGKSRLNQGIADLKAELEGVETELGQATAEAVKLKNAVAQFSDAPVTIDINHSQIDAALAKATRLANTLRGLNAGPTGGEEANVQARATGGAYNPGWLLTGERGPELKYASVGGYIAHNQALRRAAQMSDTTRRNFAAARAALSSMEAKGPRIRQRVAAQSPSASSGGTINATINITSAPGQDAREIAREVKAALAKLQRKGRTGAELHDGGDFDAA